MLHLKIILVVLYILCAPAWSAKPEFFESTSNPPKKCGAFAKIPSISEVIAQLESIPKPSGSFQIENLFNSSLPDGSILGQVQSWLAHDSKAPINARLALLKEGEVLRAEAGGMGYTFAHRVKSTGRVYRYKGEFLLLKSFHSKAIIDFAKEVDLATRAGLIGVAPETTYLRDVDLLRMENIEGVNLEEFSKNVLPTLSERARLGWIERLADTTTENLG